MANTQTNIYPLLRSRILESPLRKGHSAFLMDWPVSGAIATVIAVSDGTVSIYFSTGGGFIGGGQSHESIRRAGETALAISIDMKPHMIPTQNFPLPTPDEVAFYLVLDEGVFSATALEAHLKSGQSPFSRLGNAAQEIITQYRLKYPRPNPTVQ